MSLSDLFRQYIEDVFKTTPPEVGDHIVIPECAFCGENRRYKVYYNMRKDKGDCKVCGEYFNAIKYVMTHEDIGYKQALELLREYNSHDTITFTPISKVVEEQEDKKVILPFGELAFDHPYLVKRGISNYLVKKHNLIDVKTGRFSGRIVIPIYDINGQLITYQGRDYLGTQTPKYLFPPNFNVKTTLYNFNNLVGKTNYVILTEGVFDCFGWERCNLNSVSSFGKSISYEQMMLLHNNDVDTLYIAWDLDAIPQIISLYKKFSHLFKNIYYIFMPKDSDELTSEELHDMFTNACIYDNNSLLLLSLKYLT